MDLSNLLLCSQIENEFIGLFCNLIKLTNQIIWNEESDQGSDNLVYKFQPGNNKGALSDLDKNVPLFEGFGSINRI